MARKKASSSRSRLKNNSGVEWIGGTIAMPAFVTGEGEPYRPDALIWMHGDGGILSSTVVKPGELASVASESLQSAIEQPMAGSPHAPTRVRVASAELADALRVGHPKLDVVCAPTPEFTHLQKEMREVMTQDSEAEQSYLSAKVTPEVMGECFHAAATLFRAAPWDIVPDDESLFSLTIEPLGIRDAALSVFGQMGESFGFIKFSSVDDFFAYADAVDIIRLGDEAEMPPHFVLDFNPAADIPPSLRQEVDDHDWELADEDAYPWMMSVNEECFALPLSDQEVTMAEAIALALTTVLSEKKALLKAWDGGAPVVRTLSVETHAGEVDVTLRVPYERTPFEVDDLQGLLADLAAVPQEDGIIEHEARAALEAELLQRFMESPEGKRLPEIFISRVFMDIGANYRSRTIATMEAIDLREVLFQLIPRKVSVPASDAPAIVEELRAFYKFLKREFGLKQADSCLSLLGSGAVQKLEAAMSNTSNFGMAKSLFMDGVDAGFDLETMDGLEEWAEAIRNQPLPDPALSQSLSKKDAKAKKAKRKAGRKSRKRNR